MLDLVENLQPLEEDTFDRQLETARRSGDEPAQFALLLLASETATPISASARRLVVELFDIGSDRVRAQALGVIARLCDATLVAAVARSGWRAWPRMRYDESCYGARVLALAANDQVISFRDALNRMSTRDYGMASRMWPETSAVQEITVRIDRSIRHVAALTDDLEPPAIEIRVRQQDMFRPRVAGAIDRLFPRDHFYGDDEAHNRLKKNTEEITSFTTMLKEMGCDVIADHVDLCEFSFYRGSGQADSAQMEGYLRQSVSEETTYLAQFGIASRSWSERERSHSRCYIVRACNGSGAIDSGQLR